MNDLQDTFLQFGLDESDVALYLMLSRYGESDVQTMMTKTSFSRTTIYDSITKLTQKGLMTHRKNGRTAYYNITHPQHLERLIADKRLADAELERNMKANIATMTQSYELVSNQPGLYSFSGKEGIIQVYEELLQDKQGIDSIEDKGEMAKYIPDYYPHFIQKRMQYNIFNRVIAPSTNVINQTSVKEKRETRFVDVTAFPFAMDIKMNQRKVVFVTFQHTTAIGTVIVHPEIVRNFQILFNWLWNLQAVPR